MKYSCFLASFVLLLHVYSVKAVQFPTKTEVISTIYKANDYWQQRNPTHGNSFWNRAAYHTGNMAAYQVTGDKRYYDFSYAWSEQNLWMGARSENKENWKYSYGESNDYVLFGDFQICFQVYIDLYHIEPKEYKIARAREVMEYQMNTPNNNYWWWADGLYMVMPVMTRLYKITDNPLYLEKLYEYFLFADSIMYDADEGLYYRDAKYVYPRHKTVNGLKDFWSRGSGWVFAGFARVLEDLPHTDPHRDLYIQRYTAMASALKSSQQPEGYWTRSLLDPAHAPGPETSGTAFYTYGFAWGINNGIFSMEEYGETVEKGWNYLANFALQSDGRVGYVQPIGENANPNQTVSATSTADFGVGAFLLAASEVLQLSTGEMPEKLLRITNVNVENPRQITLEFTDKLDTVTASDIANYSLNNQAVEGVAHYDGAFKVTLHLSSDLAYGVFTIGVENLIGNPVGVLEPNTTLTHFHTVPLTEVAPYITVSAIGNQLGNPPIHTIDNSLATRWSQPGVQQWIKYDLSELKQVWAVDMAFFSGDIRFSYFDIQLSVDDVEYITVLKGGVSSGITTGLERFTFEAHPARYVRIMCNGNSTGGDNWNSLTEVRVRYDAITSTDNISVQTEQEILLFPNPLSTGDLTVVLKDETVSTAEVSLFNSGGALVFRKMIPVVAQQFIINELLLPTGNYVLQLMVNKNRIFHCLIVL